MKTNLGRHSDTIYALLRIVVGFFFACHGAQKVLGLFGGPPAEAPAFVVWTAGGIELVAGVLIMIGLFTSWAAFLSSGTMAFAYFLAHLSKGLLPIQNHGELAAVYAFVFLYIAARGSGPLAVQPD
ncbi:MAG: DoxX family protein [Deltaproteobacteria bacterium]|nr:DoxX family protein [Deltaproteobacteria bacterium]